MGRAHRFAFASLGRVPARPRTRGGAPAPSPRPPLASLGRFSPSFTLAPFGLRSLRSLGRAVFREASLPLSASVGRCAPVRCFKPQCRFPPVFYLAPLALASPRGCPLASLPLQHRQPGSLRSLGWRCCCGWSASLCPRSSGKPRGCPSLRAPSARTCGVWFS